MTLYLWKAPVVDDPDEAARLIDAWDERGDVSVFQPSDDIAMVAEELVRRFPHADDGPWGDGPPEPTDRVLFLSIRWGADNAVLDAIAELAHTYELVLYDPQGPDVSVPGDPLVAEPPSPPKLTDYLWLVPMAAAAVGVFWLGWWIDVPVLGWILMIVGGFFITVILFLIGIFIFGPKDDARLPPFGA